MTQASTDYGQQLHPESSGNNTKQRLKTNNRRRKNHTNTCTTAVHRKPTNHLGNKTGCSLFDKNESPNTDHLDNQDIRPTAPQNPAATPQCNLQSFRTITNNY